MANDQICTYFDYQTNGKVKMMDNDEVEANPEMHGYSLENVGALPLSRIQTLVGLGWRIWIVTAIKSLALCIG